MPNPLKNTAVAPATLVLRGRVCPRCHGETYPMKRGWLDRIRGHGSMLYRYECDSYRCSDREQEHTEQPLAGDFDADAVQDSRGRNCPRCHGETFRVERKLIDLFISRFSLVHRYQCDSRRCGWSGLVRQDQTTRTPHKNGM